MIALENISKMYRLGTVSSNTLQDDFKRVWYKLRGKGNPFLKIGEENNRAQSGGEYIWALKDINFTLGSGEILGIIGRNGAGKSTLLKLLSKVTKPTTGSIKTKGRIASLLEVGTGFHPELTGRENIFLNGAILGMKKSEIKSKFDEIVNFSGCERYIDTPVKRYSSGMYVRLAFAVAAHLEPEILVVDEVLAVGDIEFQKKALGKMQDVSKNHGRTVLFVSHNLSSISSLCNKAIVLKNGKMDFIGPTTDSINHYINESVNTHRFSDLRNKKSSMWKTNNIFCNLVSLESRDSNNEINSLFKMGDSLNLILKLDILKISNSIEIGIFVRDDKQTILNLILSSNDSFEIKKIGINKIGIQIDKLNLFPGEYVLGVWISVQSQIDAAYENALGFNIQGNNTLQTNINFERFRGYGNILEGKWKNYKNI